MIGVVNYYHSSHMNENIINHFSSVFPSECQHLSVTRLHKNSIYVVFLYIFVSF